MALCVKVPLVQLVFVAVSSFITVDPPICTHWFRGKRLQFVPNCNVQLVPACLDIAMPLENVWAVGCPDK